MGNKIINNNKVEFIKLNENETLKLKKFYGGKGFKMCDLSGEKITQGYLVPEQNYFISCRYFLDNKNTFKRYSKDMPINLKRLGYWDKLLRELYIKIENGFWDKLLRELYIKTDLGEN